MILVMLGTHERPFYRMAKEIENLMHEGKIKEKVIIQLGFTDYFVKGAECFRFIERIKIEKYIKNCDVLITHGGLASIMEGIKAGKPVVAVPRRKMFNEHSDDHQLQIVEETKKRGSVIPVYDIENLYDAIKKAKKLKIKKRRYMPTKMLRLVDKRLEEWSKT